MSTRTENKAPIRKQSKAQFLLYFKIIFLLQ